MGTDNYRNSITVETTVQAPAEKVWEYWTNPAHIVEWNSASPDWHTPRAINDLRVGGSFTSRMEAMDGSIGFDFAGVYDEVERHRLIAYTMGDGRRVKVEFAKKDGGTFIREEFEAESENPLEMQRMGWQSILDNFKNYAESLA